MTEKISHELGHEECKACIDAFISRHLYEDCRLDVFAREYADAFLHMYDDPTILWGKRDLCWECISYFDEKLNELLLVKREER